MDTAAAMPLQNAVPPDFACGAAGRAAEQGSALPRNLLLSIGFVESGRMDVATGRMTPWPWTVNVDGAGHYFASEQDAARFAQTAESSGARDVDVGCFQISLENHPDAFTSMDAAFDPMENAGFAAGFLNELKTQTGSWDAAIADYHSGLPALGLPYQRRVLTAWQRLGGVPEDIAPVFLALADPTVILESPAARLVHVVTMDDETPPASPWLPRVITP